jgi:tetratricopeptide (TPR) repeat protein
MLCPPIPVAVAFAAWLLAAPFAAAAEGEPECNALEAAASPKCARLLQEASTFYNAALAFERRAHRKLARDTYSQAVASAKRPMELFLAGTVPAAALRRRGIMHRELGQLSEAMADFTALIDADRGNPDARHERARTLLDLGRLHDALADSDAAVWLKPHAAEFHALRAQILARLDRRDESAAAAIEAEKYAPARQLSKVEELLKGIAPRLSKERLEELAADRDVQELELALSGVAPVFVRQRFLLQKECQDDDRHVLAIRFEGGRVAVTPSYVGAAGAMTVAESGERLVFTLGAEPCQVRVVLAKGDPPSDAPPAADDSLRRPLQRQHGAPDVEHVFHPSAVFGCARGSATVRVYWGSLDHSYRVEQSRVHVRLDQAADHRKQLLLKRPFGDEHCRITLQIWKAT